MPASSFSYSSNETDICNVPVCDPSWRAVLTTQIVTRRTLVFLVFLVLLVIFERRFSFYWRFQPQILLVKVVCANSQFSLGTVLPVYVQTESRTDTTSAWLLENPPTYSKVGSCRPQAICHLHVLSVSASGCTSTGRLGTVSCCWDEHLLAQLSWTNKWINGLFRTERRNINPTYTAHKFNPHDFYIICRYNPLAGILPIRHNFYLYNILYLILIHEMRIKLNSKWSNVSPLSKN